MKRRYLKMYQKFRKLLIKLAQEAMTKANSYRGFCVGCSVLARKPSFFWWLGFCGKYQIFTGANSKPVENGLKVCAERAAINAAIRNGFTLIIAIVVVGEPQQDDHSRIKSLTLHPCEECRRFFSEQKEIQADTIILTVHHNDKGVTEKHSVAEILKLHN